MIRNTAFTFTTIEKTPAQVEHLITDRPNRFWVLEEDKRFAGFVTCGPFRPGPGYAHTLEHTILLSPDARGSGRAALLLSHALAQVAAEGVRAMIGAVSSANPRARAFHLRQGFTEVGYLPQVGYKFGEHLDLILMQKNLVAPEHSP